MLFVGCASAPRCWNLVREAYPTSLLLSCGNLLGLGFGRGYKSANKNDQGFKTLIIFNSSILPLEDHALAPT